MDQTPWEWSGSTWCTFSDKNQAILDARALEPSLTPLRLVEGDAVLEGCPETTRFRWMSLTLDGKTATTSIRRARAAGDIPFFATVTEQGAVPLPYDVGKDLFEVRDGHWTPKQLKTVRQMGVRTLIADEGRLYEVYDPGIRELVWREKDVTRDEFEWATRTHAHWECKPPFRWQRMRQAVHAVDDPDLLRALDSFSPQLPIDATKHGPIQFPDLIRDMWTRETDVPRRQRMGTALTQLENVYASMCQEPSTWIRFDPVLNALFERARAEGRLDLTFRLRSQHYMLLFDPGGGASGASPILLRPTRYPQLLQSMEDDTREEVYRRTQEVCRAHGVDRHTWLRVLDTQEDVSRYFPPEAMSDVRQCLQDTIHLSERIATRCQAYMPTLLEKYDECGIRRVFNVSPFTRLDRHVAATLATGFRVPSNMDATFEELVAFVDDQRSTRLPNADTSTCLLCQQEAPLLGGHCGTATACLACWCATLATREMKCGFCNGTVFEGQLKLCRSVPAVPTAMPTPPALPAEVPKTADDIRQRLQAQAPALDLDAAYRMEHWYRKLLQCNLISIHQRPTHPYKKKTFRDAIKDFHLA
tara:strand:- start:1556 stop:3316 length:1761 start_codon:yes stop_codon:yes gene_type:complete